MLRTYAAVPLVLLYTLVLGPPALLAGLVDRSGRWPHAFARLWSRLILATVGIDVRVSGAENVPASPAVFAANHASAFDVPVLFGALPVVFRIVHKRSLYLLPVVGWYLYLAGHIGIDRANPFRARKSLAAAAERIRSGTNVAVFPEGTRSPDGAVHLFKRGSFVLALNANVPIVPVSLVGVKRLVPRGLLSLRSGTLAVRIHPAVATAGVDASTAETLAESVRAIVVRGCEEDVA